MKHHAKKRDAFLMRKNGGETFGGFCNPEI